MFDLRKKSFKLSALFLILFSSIGCSPKNPPIEEEPPVEEETFTVSWLNWDGSILEVDENLKYGDVPQYNGAIPTRDNDSMYSYTFDGWDPTITVVTQNKVYTAKYSKTPIVSSITLSREKIYISIGVKFKLSINENVSNVVYKTTDLNIVEQDSEGYFVGLSIGTTTIYAETSTGIRSTNECTVVCARLNYSSSNINIYNKVSSGYEMATLSDINFYFDCNVYGTPFLIYKFNLLKKNSEKFDRYKICWKLKANTNVAYSGTILSEKCSVGDTIICSGYYELNNGVSPIEYELVLFDYDY